MRSKVLILIATVLMLGVGVAVYAYNSNSAAAPVVAMSGGCCGDSCPMKAKGEHKMAGHDMKAGEGHSCCGDSCPMKAAKGEQKMAGEGHSCCGDSCPMKAAKGEHKMAGHDMKAGEGHSCCGDSCPMKAKGDKAPADHSAMGHAMPAATGEKALTCCACCSKNKEAKKDTAI